MTNFFAPALVFVPIVEGTSGEGSVQNLIFFFILAIGTSFLCSILEAVLLSSSLSQIELMVVQGSRAGRLMQRHKQNVERPISAILTLNTFAHTAGSIGVGAEAAAIFGNEWTGVISAIMTMLILVLSEIIPKTLGAVYWKPLVGFSAYTIQGMVLILFPAVWIFEKLTRLLHSSSDVPTITRSEIEVMARIGGAEGSLPEGENRVLSNMFRLDRLKIEQIMTPRTVMMALHEDLLVRDVIEQHRIKPLPFSRIPIYQHDLDHINQFVLRQDILTKAADNEYDVKLKEIGRDLPVLPETNTIGVTMEKMIMDKIHIALVIDEYGGTAGIISLEDCLETLLGLEIVDESDTQTDLRDFAGKRRELKLQQINKLTKTFPSLANDLGASIGSSEREHQNPSDLD